MKPDFIKLRPKSLKNNQRTQTAITSNFSSRISKTPSFINEVVRQWPSWEILKENVGILNIPKSMIGDERFNFQKVGNVPLPINKYMRSITIIGYQYFTDRENGLIYFYPFYSIYGAAYMEKDSHPAKQELGEFAEVNVKVVNLKSGLKELEELKKKYNRQV